MENLTKISGAVKLVNELSPIPGYSVMVFRETKEGNQLESILRPGDKPLRRSFFNTSGYFGYAVNIGETLKFEINKHILLNDAVHDFSLHGTVHFRVSEPQKLAFMYERDPVRLIKNEMHDRYEQEAKNANWHDILKNFAEIQTRLVDGSVMQRIKEYSETYGVKIAEVNLYRTIPEKIVEPDIKKETVDREIKIDKMEDEKKTNLRRLQRRFELDEAAHKGNLKDTYRDDQYKDQILKNQNLLNNQMIHAFSEGLKGVADRVDSPESLEKFIQTMSRTIKSVTNGPAFESQQTGSAVESSPSTQAIENKQSNKDDQDIFTDILNDVESLSCDQKDKGELIASIKRIKMELSLGDCMDQDSLSKNYQKLQQDFVKLYKLMPQKLADQFEKLNDLIKSKINPTE